MKHRNELPLFLKTNGYNIGVEIGVEYGENACNILKNWDGKLVCVDYWDNQEIHNYNEPCNFKNFNEVFSVFKENIKEFDDRVLVVKNKSDIASKFFPDEHFDFIYIDGNHSYLEVKKDLECWWSKLKKGGLFSGHDWLDNFKPDDDKNVDVYYENLYLGKYGVNSAVIEFANDKGYKINTTEEKFATWYFKK